MKKVIKMHELNRTGRLDRDLVISDILLANQDYIQSIYDIKSKENTPNVGDWIVIAPDHFVRIALNNQGDISISEDGQGGFCLFPDGEVDFGGTFSLEKPIDSKKLVFESFEKEGSAWIFDRGEIIANNRVDIKFNFKVWSIKP